MKPLGRKNYGSIGHLPNSRMGPSDRSVHEGQARICTEKTRDRRDVVIVTEKLDGSNVGIANIDGHIVALGRAGHLAQSSMFEQHQLFADWVREREGKFAHAIPRGWRLVGEWMAQAHGTIYTLPHGPFAAFDLMQGDRRAPFSRLRTICGTHGIPMPKLIHVGGAISVELAMDLHGPGLHGADEPEGVVYRVERDGEVDFLAKWVRPDKVDGKWLPGLSVSITDRDVWNWRPERGARLL